MTIFKIQDAPLGFFDSGVGGLSVLKEAVKLLPNENFIYFGDSQNAPYGTKSVDEVRTLSFNAVDFLIKKGVKAIVVACNTATSAAIEELRTKYSNMPVIGIEPALKPAVELNRNGKVLIMATPVTLQEKKFNNLMKHFEKQAEIVPLPCPGLCELIETGNIKGEKTNIFLREILAPFNSNAIASIVLGCTHYPFIKHEISTIIGEDIPIIDGSLGTAAQLKRQLFLHELTSTRSEKGKVYIYNSLKSDEIISLSYKLLND